jgi:AcrR family transcriptional regulator
MPTRTAGAITKDAIKSEALALFLDHGYDTTTLEDIAQRLSITRPAVLYHFRSKEALLRSIIDPGYQAIDATLRGFTPVATPTTHDQERVLRALLTAHLAHRDAVALITRFPNNYIGAGIGEMAAGLNRRCAALLGGNRLDNHPILRVKVASTLAALSGVLGARLHVPLNTHAEREALLHALLAMLHS